MAPPTLQQIAFFCSQEDRLGIHIHTTELQPAQKHNDGIAEAFEPNAVDMMTRKDLARVLRPGQMFYKVRSCPLQLRRHPASTCNSAPALRRGAKVQEEDMGQGITLALFASTTSRAERTPTAPPQKAATIGSTAARLLGRCTACTKSAYEVPAQHQPPVT